MKVTFLADKYRVGSERGLYAHEKEGILEDLNLVVDLEGSVYPEKWVETEDGKAYHKTEQTMDEFFEGRAEKKLEPGDMFVYEGQVLAIDRPDRLIVCVSESGALSVVRFVEEGPAGGLDSHALHLGAREGLYRPGRRVRHLRDPGAGGVEREDRGRPGYPEEVEAEMLEPLTAEFMSRSWNQVKTVEKETSLTTKD